MKILTQRFTWISYFNLNYCHILKIFDEGNKKDQMKPHFASQQVGIERKEFNFSTGPSLNIDSKSCMTVHFLRELFQDISGKKRSVSHRTTLTIILFMNRVQYSKSNAVFHPNNLHLKMVFSRILTGFQGHYF